MRMNSEFSITRKYLIVSEKQNTENISYILNKSSFLTFRFIDDVSASECGKMPEGGTQGLADNQPSCSTTQEKNP